jgi:acetyltransferase-like isoleucine patch superfamily enzyme
MVAAAIHQRIIMKPKPKPKSKLLNEIRGLYEALRKEMKRKWKRDLPFEELLFDRWERAKNLGFGKGTSIYHNSYVYGNVKVGRNTWIGPFTLLDGSGGLTIGDNCSISAGVHIYSHDSVKWAVSGGKAPYDHKAVQIGSHCFIGPHSVVRSGVKIGKHAVIGAQSFVNRDIPDYAIAFGNPVRIVGRVFMDRKGKIEFRYSK